MKKEITVLNRNFLFQRVYKRGKNYVSPLLVTYVMKRRDGGLRIGVTASKKIGCAVERNRARRVIKAAASGLLPQAGGPFDVVFVCRGATGSAKSHEIAAVMEQHLRQAGILSC